VPTINVNGEDKQLDVADDMPLLWALREKLGLLGTKFGCGKSQCGACTVLADGEPTRSCQTSVGDVAGMQIVTIENAAQDADLRKVQDAWVAAQVPQCGYCQSGQVLAAYALLKSNPQPDESAIVGAMNGNLCRCGTYNGIKEAIQAAASSLAGGGGGG
jgi:isoquinoline 1-oxidoreductase alpha subunit